MYFSTKKEADISADPASLFPHPGIFAAGSIPGGISECPSVADISLIFLEYLTVLHKSLNLCVKKFEVRFTEEHNLLPDKSHTTLLSSFE